VKNIGKLPLGAADAMLSIQIHHIAILTFINASSMVCSTIKVFWAQITAEKISIPYSPFIAFFDRNTSSIFVIRKAIFLRGIDINGAIIA